MPKCDLCGTQITLRDRSYIKTLAKKHLHTCYKCGTDFVKHHPFLAYSVRHPPPST